MTFKYISFGKRTQNTQSAFIRMELTCKGLNEHGIASKIFTIHSAVLENKIFHFFGHLICLIKTGIILLTAKKTDVIVFYGEYPYYFLFKIFHKRARLFIEKHEYSSHLIFNSLSAKSIEISKKFESHLKYFEGFITCSDTLKDYFQKLISPNCKTFVLPLMLDFKKFTGKIYDKEKYIGYCGDFGNNKDGVPTLIKAFHIISNKFPLFNLYLAGSTENIIVMKNIKELVINLKLHDRIVFTGTLNHDAMPQFLGKASALALARPKNLQAAGGFPSKIGEYLASGRPVAVTRVGELDRYLKDRENVFFSKSDSAEDFADCLESILVDEDFSNKVGVSGKILAQSFDYFKQADILFKYFKNLH